MAAAESRTGPLPMRPTRLSARELSLHLGLESSETVRLVKKLRATVLKLAPQAAEAIRFGVLWYYHPDAWFGSIGGNICTIEVKDRPAREGGGRGVDLAFVHGHALPDPAGLLRGKGKVKRRTAIPGAAAAASPEVAALICAARDLRPWE